MKEIQKIMSEELTKLFESGEVALIVESKLTKAIDDVVGGMFRYNSPVKKLLEEKITSEVGIPIERFQFKNYAAIIAEQACRVVEESYLDPKMRDKITKDIKDFLDDTKTEDVDMFDLVEDMVALYHEDEYDTCMDENALSMFNDWTCIIEPTDSYSDGTREWYFIYIDPARSGIRKYSCSVRLFVTDGEISSLTLDGTLVKAGAPFDRVDGFATKLVNMYYRGKKILNIGDFDADNY